MGFAQDAYRFFVITGGVFIALGIILPFDDRIRMFGVLFGIGILALGLVLRKLYWSGKLPKF
jgi:hypothetical protein